MIQYHKHNEQDMHCPFHHRH